MTDDEFWNLVDVRLPDECWMFLGGSTGKDGRYGCVGGKVTAHRRAYELSTGEPIPDGFWVGACVKNPRCCNPEHLRCDTPKKVFLSNPNWARTHRVKVVS
jgi:hypothetical protein